MADDKQEQNEHIHKLESAWRQDLKEQTKQARQPGMPESNDQMRIREASYMRPFDSLAQDVESIDNNLKYCKSMLKLTEAETLKKNKSKEEKKDINDTLQYYKSQVAIHQKIGNEGKLEKDAFQHALEIYDAQKKVSKETDAGNVLDYAQGLQENGKLKLADYLQELLKAQQKNGASASFQAVIINLDMYLKGTNNNLALAPVMDAVNAYIESHSGRMRFSKHGADRLKLMANLKEALSMAEDDIRKEYDSRKEDAVPSFKEETLTIYSRALDRSFTEDSRPDGITDVMSTLSRYRYLQMEFTNSKNDQFKPGSKEYNVLKERFRKSLIEKINDYKENHGSSTKESVKERIVLLNGILDELSEPEADDPVLQEQNKNKMYADMDEMVSKYNSTPEIMNDKMEGLTDISDSPEVQKEQIIRLCRGAKKEGYIGECGGLHVGDVLEDQGTAERDYSNPALLIGAAFKYSTKPVSAEQYHDPKIFKEQQRSAVEHTMHNFECAYKIKYSKHLYDLDLGLLRNIYNKAQKMEKNPSDDMVMRANEVAEQALEERVKKEEKERGRNLTPEERRELADQLVKDAIHQQVLYSMVYSPEGTDYATVDLFISQSYNSFNVIMTSYMADVIKKDPVFKKVSEYADQMKHSEDHISLLPKEYVLDMKNRHAKYCFDQLKKNNQLKDGVKFKPLTK